MNPSPANPLRIATRSTDVALRRANVVQRALAALGLESVLVKLKTAGDKKEPAALHSISERGTFTKDLEKALLKGKADIAVHPLDLLPSDGIDGLVIAALLERGDARDAVVISDQAQASSLEELPAGSRISTPNFRIRAQLRLLRPDLDSAELHGDLSERLKKIDQGRVHAAIVPACSLHLLGAEQRIASELEPPGWLSAPGQGIITLQTRADDVSTRTLLAPLHHAPTASIASAELAFANALEGGAQVPLGVAATATGLFGFIASLDGARAVRGVVVLDPDDPALSGIRLANQLRSDGASELLEGLRRAMHIMPPAPE